jgi:arginyl-tRNA synthetase
MKQNIIDTIKDIIGHDNIVLEVPKDKSMGHYATPVSFALAKSLRKPPIVIASDLANRLESLEIFESVEAVKGFINFKLSNSFLQSQVDTVLLDEDSFAKQKSKSEKILLEFVSANPTGPLHIGHARGAIVGDILLKIGKHLGYSMVSEYYVNDAGNQIELLGISLQLAYKTNILNLEVEYPQSYYKGEYISDVAKSIYSTYGDDIFSEGEFDKLCLIAKDMMLEIIKSNLDGLGVEFDNYISEKSLYIKQDEVMARLIASGNTYTKDNKLWLQSTNFGDELDRVIVRDNGVGTYLAGDIIYHDDKFSRDFDEYINIWGADHHGYIKRVKASINFLGYDENKLEIVLAQMVALLQDGEPYKMSKRAGNFILMSDVVEDIGADALRFIFASKKIDTHLEFDVNSLNATDSTNPVFYINYAHARVNSLIAKAEISRDDIIKTELVDLDDESKSLIFESLLLPGVLEDAFKNRGVQKLTEYLKHLSAMIHSFYNSHKVIGSTNQLQLLKVLLMAQTTLRVGLKLLGIKAKDSM